MQVKVKTRFAPSPTGHLHIGGARTALFNFLFARKHGGSFVLRIEDTDRERSTDENTRAILDSMSWLGMSCDEGPYFQSERTDIYLEHIDKLLAEGKAYRCDCTPEMLDEKRRIAMQKKEKPKYDGTCRGRDVSPDVPHVVRFRGPDIGETVVNDLLRGPVVFDNAETDDLILLRTDGSPTYNVSVVVDDALMGMTHVIRGDDHLVNTPRQVQIYEALGYEPPKFVHVPMILGQDKKRLSKRHGATSVEAYKEAGYIPEALVNFLVRLGWSHGDQEIFSMDEMVELFDIDGLGKSAGVFNEEKLHWLNATYIKEATDDKLAAMVTPLLEAKGWDVSDEGKLKVLMDAFRPRATFLVDFAEKAAPYYEAEVEMDPKAVKKWLKPSIIKPLEELLEAFRSGEWTEAALEKSFNGIVEKHELNMGKVAQPIRVSLTGSTVSPGIFETLLLVGRDRALSRIEGGIEIARARGEEHQ